MTDTRFDAAARLLADARASRTPGPRVSESYTLASLDDAYAVQFAGLRAVLAAGRRLSGAKAGLTSTPMRAALKLSEPLHGHLLADTRCAPGPLPAERLLQPKVEAEIALVLARDLDGEPDLEALRAALAGAAPALEINDSAIAGWQITLFDAVADNLSAGLYVLGEAVTPLEQLGDSLTVSLQRNDAALFPPAEVRLDAVLETALWLARSRARLGYPLRAGDVLLTGAVAPAISIAAGDRLTLEIAGLGGIVSWLD
ncbi:fumarylacetoacetate hydrolase family protein [Pseudomonas sp. UL073]|uniref:Fumarylacetoacetate hydrolase family protein n=1 Tax=Zestomonas insulae TaxID=2809017 RepID=A0ABS2I7Z6_9GAMM|nr:fumarylacetoacetate hydrolase family protein [Pseudomonas insulae]MBM7059276.1 fumarylacetoacetate hydrolase family protein [Pseudomonas insulae]